MANDLKELTDFANEVRDLLLGKYDDVEVQKVVKNHDEILVGVTVRTKNNRAPDGEDRYAVRSTCFLAEDRNTIVLQEDSFIAMEAALQIRIDSAVKEQVEALYRNLGTSFAEAVRMFAQQSLQEGGMPFRPSLRAWDDMSEAEISEKLSRSSEDIAAGRISAQCDMDAQVKKLIQSRVAKI